MQENKATDYLLVRKKKVTMVFHIFIYFFLEEMQSYYCCCCSVDKFMCDFLWTYGLQHTRLPCPPPSHRVCSNSSPLSQWCHPTISTLHPLLLLPSIFSSIRVFFNESALHIRWPTYWSFSFSPSNEYSGLISFRIDCFDLLDFQGTLKSHLQYHSLKASVLWCYILTFINNM